MTFDDGPVAGSGHRVSPNLSVVSGRGRGRLGHDRVAGEQGPGATLDHQDEHREVPRRDRRDDAERLAPAHHLPSGILLEHLGRQVECGESSGSPRSRRPDLNERLRQRLALFLGQEAGESGPAPPRAHRPSLTSSAPPFPERRRRPAPGTPPSRRPRLHPSCARSALGAVARGPLGTPG